jgi:ribosomal peptide maturation radical SAM protein 1
MPGMTQQTNRPIALVSLPTASGRFPCFQNALLKPTLERAGIEVELFSLFIHFGAQIGWPLHEAISEVSDSLIGEWIWAKQAFGALVDDAGYIEQFSGTLDTICEHASCTVDEFLRLRDEATASFIQHWVENVDWGRFGLVGFTVLFQQQLATIAFTRALKERFPRLPIILGGGHFEDDIAHEFMSHFPQIDYIHCGDADTTLPEFVRRLYAGQSMNGLAGILWRDGGRIVYEGRAPNHLDMDATPVPDFDEYFEVREASGYDSFADADAAILPIETARGCWWGEKNHCTFCGLNRAGLKFRAKSVKNTLEMLESLAVKYDVLRFNGIDNILDPSYMEELFDALATAKCDFEIHYALRPGLNREQLRRLRAGGIVSVQPGIESFSTNVLRVMKKGVTGIRNLEMVKWCTYYEIVNLYNILFGFTGETPEDYLEQYELVSRIPHLQPPYAIAQARPDRGSPMYNDPAEHKITSLSPSPCYKFLYPAQIFDLSKVSYYYVPDPPHSLPYEDYAPFVRLVEAWKKRWSEDPRPSLIYQKSIDSIRILDKRSEVERQFRFSGREARLFEFCADAKSLAEIERAFGGPASWINQLLEELVQRDLFFHMDGKYLGLALPANRAH